MVVVLAEEGEDREGEIRKEEKGKDRQNKVIVVVEGGGEDRAEESSSSSSAGSPPSEKLRSLSASPFIDGVSRSDSFVRDNHHFLETADLHPAPSTLITNDQGGDYPPAIGFGDVKYICLLESSKLWAIAGPIAFNIICNYGVNSFTNIFVGHIGDIELSAVAISLSVIANFSFGFLIPRVKIKVLGLVHEVSRAVLKVILTLPLMLYKGENRMNINGWEGMLFIGINAAISVRVSNELGSGHPRAAKYAVIVTCIESLLIGILCAVIILATRNHFAIIFTASEEMRKAVANLAYLLGITMLLNSVQPVISGVAVGGGWQALVAYINLFCYYVVGLPLGFLLGYKTKLHVKGIWIGMIIGTCLQTLILVYIVYKTNWNKEVEQASERMRKWGGQEEQQLSAADSNQINILTT
uniref:Protein DETOXIFICATION n=1 Tax=Populus alba TaxID=43335 RepID=A0A4U5Q7T9_POPAL|nr:hypothetical protein D5086_0000125190 [Populus alba]